MTCSPPITAHLLHLLLDGVTAAVGARDELGGVGGGLKNILEIGGKIFVLIDQSTKYTHTSTSRRQQQLSMTVARAEVSLIPLTSRATTTTLLPRVAAVAGGKVSLKTCFIKGDNLYCGAADGDREARCSIMPWRGLSLNCVTDYPSRI